jgi:hypothetical protein
VAKALVTNEFRKVGSAYIFIKVDGTTKIRLIEELPQVSSMPNIFPRF